MDNTKILEKYLYLIKNWLENNKKILTQLNIDYSILINNSEVFLLNLETDEKMGEILVEEASFAPYRFIKFEIAQIIDGQARIVFAWYDDELTTEIDIEDALNDGIKFLSK